METEDEAVIVRIGERTIRFPLSISGLVDELVDFGETEIIFEHYLEIWEYMRDREIRSIGHVLEIINSAMFYRMSEEIFYELSEYFWRYLPSYEGDKIVITPPVAKYLDLDKNVVSLVTNLSKFGAIDADLTLNMEAARLLEEMPPFNVVGLDLAKLTKEEHDYVQNIINAFADTLETLKVATMNTLEHVVQLPKLRTLDISKSKNLKSLAFCERTLEKLNICSTDYDDEFLAGATKLKILHASHCPYITTVAPFADSLIELNINSSFRISDAGLANARNIEIFSAQRNSRITTVEPFANSLRILDASDHCGIGDAGLINATRIEYLDATANPKISTIKPFAKTLRTLVIAWDSGITDAGLTEAASIETLDVQYNKKITTVEPFAKTLTSLDASESAGITDEGLRMATSIRELNATNNSRITTVQPFASVLRKLEAGGECGIGDEALRLATGLRVLNANNNPKITKIAPFANTLTHLEANGSCGISDAELVGAIKLEHLVGLRNPKITRCLVRFGSRGAAVTLKNRVRE
jgi:hypothetical protein